MGIDDFKDKLHEGIDTAGDVANDKTGGKYSDQIDDGAAKAKDALGGAAEAGADAADSTKDAAGSAADSASDAADSAKESGESLLGKAQDAAEDLKDRAKNLFGGKKS